MHELLAPAGWRGLAPNRAPLKRHASSYTRLERGNGRQAKLHRDTEAKYSKKAAMHAPDVLPSKLTAPFQPPAGAITHVTSTPAQLDAAGAARADKSARMRIPPIPLYYAWGKGASSGTAAAADDAAASPTDAGASSGAHCAHSPSSPSSGISRAGLRDHRSATHTHASASPSTGAPRPRAQTLIARRRAPPLGRCFFPLSPQQEATLWHFRVAYRKFRLGGSKGAGEVPHRLARHRNVWRLRNSDFHKNIETADGFSLSHAHSYASASPPEPVTIAPDILVDVIRGCHSAGELQTRFATELALVLSEIEDGVERDGARAMDVEPLETLHEGLEPDEALAVAPPLGAAPAADGGAPAAELALPPTHLPLAAAPSALAGARLAGKAGGKAAPNAAALSAAKVAAASAAAAQHAQQQALAARRPTVGTTGTKGFKKVSEFTRHFKLGRELGKGHFSSVRHARLRERPLTDEQLAAAEPPIVDAPPGTPAAARLIEARLSKALNLGGAEGGCAPPAATSSTAAAAAAPAPAATAAAHGAAPAATPAAAAAAAAAIAAAHARYPAEVAVKILKKPSSEKQMDLLMREVQICMLLSDHRAFCNLIDRFESEESFYLVLEVRGSRGRTSHLLRARAGGRAGGGQTRQRAASAQSTRARACAPRSRASSAAWRVRPRCAPTPLLAPHSARLRAQLCDGGELFDRICDDYDGAYPEEEARKLMRVLFEAIAAMHALGVIHRDLKVRNAIARRRPSARRRLPAPSPPPCAPHARAHTRATPRPGRWRTCSLSTEICRRCPRSPTLASRAASTTRTKA